VARENRQACRSLPGSVRKGTTTTFRTKTVQRVRRRAYEGQLELPRFGIGCGYNARMSAAISPIQQLQSALRSEAITPRAAVEQVLARANSNSGRNVYIALDAQRALRDADEQPRRFPGANKPPLYGLPVSLKDCFDLAGCVTTAGSRFYAQRNAPANEDSAVAARLRSQGAVIVGKTHLHPLAYGITGENPDYGDSTQPCNAALLTGGSSSGGVASVQEGSAVAAIGTDTGGSIRVPAALCGLAGYRASLELAHERGLWRGGVHLAYSFDTLGWLFRDLRDASLLAAALFDLDVPAVAETTIRIGVAGREFLDDCEPVVKDCFGRWQQRLLDFGAEFVSVDSSFWDGAMEIYASIQASEAAAIHMAATGGDFSVFERTIAQRLAWGASIPAEEVRQFRQRHAGFREKMDALLREHDFLIVPCAPVARLLVGADHGNSRKAILRYTTPFSLAGNPVVTLPGEDGAGVQLAAARGRDAKLLAYAARLGAAF
jgi:Asp-tRNA(Asn)/Glu-tRNA(Gln) amidotransferase A subunit family amidase